MRLLLFAGTGGAGTTTVAAATAVDAARRGVKTLLLTPEPTTAPAAGPLGVADGEVEPGLVVRQVDARARARRAWAALGGPASALAGALGVDPVESAEFAGLPGLDDLLTLVELRDAAAAGWDLVVVDAPPLARTVRLLALPEAAARAVGRLLPIERRMLWAMGHGASPSGVPTPARGLVEAAERVQAELAGVREVLTGAGTSIRLVLTAQPAALAAATGAWTALALHGLAVDGVVVNRLVPGGDDPWRAARARAQAGVLADAEDALAPLPVARLAERAVPPAGPGELAELAQELRVEADRRTAGGLVVERDGDGFVLVLPLPGAQRKDLELHRRGDELLLDLAGERRVLALPSVLRRCDVTAAALRDGALRVAFRPDPEQWRSL